MYWTTLYKFRVNYTFNERAESMDLLALESSTAERYVKQHFEGAVVNQCFRMESFQFLSEHPDLSGEQVIIPPRKKTIGER